jgi:hypothetical protein
MLYAPPLTLQADGETIRAILQERGGSVAINESKLQEFLGKAVGDFGAVMSAALVLIGDKLGLYKM